MAHYWRCWLYRIKYSRIVVKHNQIVIGLDNFSTGNQNNLLDVKL